MRLLLGAKSAPFGCMYAETVGCMYAVVGCKVYGDVWVQSICLLGASLIRLIACLTVGSLPDSRWLHSPRVSCSLGPGASMGPGPKQSKQSNSQTIKQSNNQTIKQSNNQTTNQTNNQTIKNQTIGNSVGNTIIK